MSEFWRNKRVWVTGGNGFLGRVVCRFLREAKAQLLAPTSSEVDLTDTAAVYKYFDQHPADIVIHLAAQVGGIGANQRNPGRFFYANMMMGLNVIEACRLRGVQRFVQVGTVCAYPNHTPIPFHEEDLWNGFPEPTNAPYGIAKRALAVMIDSYRQQYSFPGIYLIPTNLYGPEDNFDLENSHVIAALIRKICEAKSLGKREVNCWGTGKAWREFLYVDDAARAIIAAAEQHDDSQPLNIGSGEEIQIGDLAKRIAKLCDYNGALIWDSNRPDGQHRRLLDTTKIRNATNWRPEVFLDEGLRRTVDWWKTTAVSPNSPR